MDTLGRSWTSMAWLMVTPGESGATCAVLGVEHLQVEALEVHGPRGAVLHGEVLDAPAGLGQLQLFEDHVDVARVILDLDRGEVVERLAQHRLRGVALKEAGDRVLVAARREPKGV